MDAAELKLVFASNLINLRTAAGMTQAELGTQLNYSDKTVSKWERGEAVPDAYVLTQLAALFGVTVKITIIKALIAGFFGIPGAAAVILWDLFVK